MDPRKFLRALDRATSADLMHGHGTAIPVGCGFCGGPAELGRRQIGWTLSVPTVTVKPQVRHERGNEITCCVLTGPYTGQKE
jgi:hypothetical protein